MLVPSTSYPPHRGAHVSVRTYVHTQSEEALIVERDYLVRCPLLTEIDISN